jgi:hypothetical protein
MEIFNVDNTKKVFEHDFNPHSCTSHSRNISPELKNKINCLLSYFLVFNVVTFKLYCLRKSVSVLCALNRRPKQY